MTFDPFNDYDQRGCLRNVAGEKDVEIVKRLEHREFQINAGKALDRLSKIEIPGYRDVLDTHKTLFAGVYPRAGQDRMQTAPAIAISKAGKPDMFPDPRHVRRATGHALSQGQDRSFMRDKPGEVMGSLAHAHPFLDGNGRTIMTVHAQLATRAGINIDWQKTDKRDYLKALTGERDRPGKGELDAYPWAFVQAAVTRRQSVAALKLLPGRDRAPRRASRPRSRISQSPNHDRCGNPSRRQSRISPHPRHAKRHVHNLSRFGFFAAMVSSASGWPSPGAGVLRCEIPSRNRCRPVPRGHRHGLSGDPPRIRSSAAAAR